MNTDLFGVEIDNDVAQPWAPTKLIKRYSIMARELYSDGTWVEVCQCDSDPHAVADAVRNKKISIGKGKKKVAQYGDVMIKDNHAPK
jgi:hypothetical protein